MKLSTSTIFVIIGTANSAFVSHSSLSVKRCSVAVKGYLDDISNDLYKESDEPDVVKDSAEYNKMSKDQIDRYGPGNLDQFVDFEEFDGGDGQMGVAGDGEKGLDKSDFQTGSFAKDMNKSKMRSARNAWGSSTGYADKLIKEKGMDTARAQQLENWANQQEIKRMNQQQKYMADEFDRVQDNAEADWRTLAKFGVERNEKFDLDETFGAVAPGNDIEGTIELTGRVGGAIAIHEFSLKNPYMGFADFRAAFTPDTPMAWSVTPNEGSLQQRTPTDFVVKFRPESIGVFEGYLVIETEDFKKTWKVIGGTG